jgi:putative membrane protein
METQPERTALSWQRTGLGVLAVAGLIGHGAVRAQDPAGLVAAGLAALLGLGVLGGLAPVRYRRLRRQQATGAVSPAPAVAATAVVVLVAVLAGYAVVMRG